MFFKIALFVTIENLGLQKYCQYCLAYFKVGGRDDNKNRQSKPFEVSAWRLYYMFVVLIIVWFCVVSVSGDSEIHKIIRLKIGKNRI